MSELMNAGYQNVPSIFSFEQFQIRTIVMDGDPWFIAKDIAEALGYSDTDKAIRNHCKRAKLLKPAELAGLEIGPRGAVVIPEGDIYRLSAKSQLPSAEKFESWVFDEVLPSIRKTGNYSAPLTLEMQMAQGLLAAHRLIEQKDVAIAERDKMIAIVAPKAAALDRIANTDGLTCISTAAKVLKKGPKELFQWLYANKWIFKRPGGKHWLAHQDKLRLGYLEHKLYTYKGSDGEEKTETQAYITVKGITKLASIFGTAQCELEVAV